MIGHTAAECFAVVFSALYTSARHPAATVRPVRAAQWFATANRDIDELSGQIAARNPLFEEATGSTLDAGDFKQHLEARYL
jgi:hypothetical protein